MLAKRSSRLYYTFMSWRCSKTRPAVNNSHFRSLVVIWRGPALIMNYDVDNSGPLGFRFLVP